ncbi:IS1480a transposase [Xanthomonas fragariae LMG 25863]|nr:IS1480a transposase [Xanthomonas fragariae LMG 25863]
MIVDAQSVKNTDTAGQKGYDAGKKVSGIKRHIAVDTQGALCHRGDDGGGDRPQRCAAGAGALSVKLDACTKPAVRQWLHRSTVCRRRARDSRRAAHGADCQAQRTAHLQGHAQALDRRAQFCLAGEKPKAVEELRAQTQHQLAVHPSGLLGASTQKIVNRLLDKSLTSTGPGSQPQPAGLSSLYTCVAGVSSSSCSEKLPPNAYR